MSTASPWKRPNTRLRRGSTRTPPRSTSTSTPRSQTPRGKRLIYGGVAISLARSLAFNGLSNAAEIIAINAGTHVNPLFAGDTVFAWSEVLDKVELCGTAGALRLRLVATKNLPCGEFPYKDTEGKHLPDVILDFDYWAAIPNRG
jgi:2-methylfumaryl-CoA hydratase